MTREQRMCTSKCRYPSQYYANTVALHRMRDGAPSLRSYWCPCCHKFHLTRQA